MKLNIFFIAITIAKSTIFILVGLLEFIVHSPKNLSRASIFAIFCTQTNDFGMGLPILNAVYGQNHPFVGLLYLVAPISLLILNPIGFVLMEADRNKSENTYKIFERFKLIINVFKGLLMNPVIFMTFLGIIANNFYNGNIPNILSKFLDALGSAFTALAPFTLGLSITGKLGNIRSQVFKPILALVVTKSILTPIITHICVNQMSAMLTGSSNPALSNFGFLYGTFPTALGVDSYARQYDVSPDLISAAIVICTVLSAPLMYISASILTVLNVDHELYLLNLMNFQYNVCKFSIIGVILIALIFLISGRYQRMPQSLTTSLLILSFQTAMGGILCSGGVGTNIWMRYIKVEYHIYIKKLS